MVAIEILEDAKRSVGKNHPQMNLLINNLSQYYFIIDDYEKSLLILEEELIRLRSLDKKKYSYYDNSNLWEQDYLLIIGNLGETFLALKKYKSSYSYLKESLELASKLYSENSGLRG